MPFFPGFTDHSPRHITDVLNTAASLISDASHELLSAQDVAVLCMAILLHDCGMHLTQDTFRELVQERDAVLIDGFGDAPWGRLWKDFLSEAKRFGQEKLIAIFGSSDPLKIDEIDLNNLNEHNCLLIGEFVRRHHTRLAHEIAINGVKRVGGLPLELIGFDADLKDLSGLIARSHGMSIRGTFSYLQDKYDILGVYRDIKTPYLMAVLRIADYIQVKSERAIQTLLRVKELRSPISRQEWAAHFAVRDVSTHHADPEAFYVHAAPLDVRTYLKLVLLFKDIQKELDESWATLGEVYGRNATLYRLGLTIRRIRSNLDMREKFAKNVNYIPIKAGFDSSGPDLLKLLVGPLYNYEYSVGIRELVQNAVDACREAEDLVGQIANIESNYSPEVIVQVEEQDDGTGWITIADNGVGMTLDTVTRYFLIAGASFRNSDLWKSQHTVENGEVRVIRGGRFGVGALAAFLMGEEIEVTTRHIDRPSDSGIKFVARIDNPLLELNKCTAPAGTTIRVRVTNKEVFSHLRPRAPLSLLQSREKFKLKSWHEVDWFIQEEPAVSYHWNGFSYPIGNYGDGDDNRPIKFNAEFSPDKELFAPKLGAEDPRWRSLSQPNPYREVRWRYADRVKQGSGDKEYVLLPINLVSVNGIRVEELRNHEERGNLTLPQEESSSGPIYSITRPSIAIYDPAGLCPINLQRSTVAFERMDLDEKIIPEVLDMYFKDIRNKISKFLYFYNFMELCKLLGRSGYVRYSGQVSSVFCTSSEVKILCASNIKKLGIKRIFFADVYGEPSKILISDLLQPDEALVMRVGNEGYGSQAALSWFRAVFSSDATEEYSRSRQVGFPVLAHDGAVSVMPKKTWASASEKGKVARYIMDNLVVDTIDKKYFSISAYDSGENSFLIDRCRDILTSLESNVPMEVAAWKLKEEQPFSEAKSILADAWDKVFFQ